ncbi:putative nucleotidyltransferase, Ribonuclease H [Rosa chinensis]|uniref:Putative nucleotidyltransferase, Ribonuclease H n=1 Tax=Rosa chinensis TaxID=74649 RepID=A0A2P6QWF2_ROSCH|nr:putative nucleotidyltransferase, Ribonuclease H [Rosa chinensis]
MCGGEKPQTWVQALPWAEWWYNTASHSAILMSPFEALYGYAPPPTLPYLPGSTTLAQVDQQLKSRDELLSSLKRNLVRAQARMKGFHDRKHSERTFAVGDMVYLKLQPYKQQTLHQGAFHKLSAKYYGPFAVTERIGSVAYRLKLPANAKIHNVFHVSLLKKKIGDNASVASQLPPIMDPANPKWTPSAVLQRRMVKRHGAATTQWLVQWFGTTPEEAIWEFADEILLRFPNFDSET